ncbi:hypothetical protein FHR99_001298 [Litorivivens lipolytica]|uniref:DUF3014 domain-containing protein n=1 Tax=Litorivivens lipolytica TaxID=1524264 RepID=A0A7W4W428_9GAMM|nr:hypothetical protein [Litorivivens lipolytica]
MNGKIILAILVAISGAVGYVFYTSSQSEWNEISEPEPVVEPAAPAAPEPEPEPPKPEPEPEPEPQPEPEPEPEEPVEEESEPVAKPEPQLVQAPDKLAGSDSKVQQAVTDLAQRLVRWVTLPEQIRKWVLTVDLMASEKIPYKHSPIKYDKDPFLVLPTGDETYVADSGNYSRWNDIVGVVADIPVQDAARYYREWSPLLEKAYDELGKQGSFHERFMVMLDEMRSVSEPPVGATLIRPHIFYQYADPELEAASPLTKWMWRLGPDNMLELQDFARNLSAELKYR